MADSPVCVSSDVGSVLLESVRALLPDGGKVLLVGPALGVLKATLAGAGYALDCVECQHPESHSTCANPVRDALFEQIAEGRAWDLVVLQSGLIALDPVDVFDLLPALLSAQSAGLLLLDSFCLERADERASTKPLLDYVGRLASRAGFSFRIVKTLRESLAGREAYLLLHCQKQQDLRWRVGWIGRERASEMRALFHEVFGHEMSDAHWHWKYGDGRGCGIGIWRTDNGRLIAHYGGTTRSAVCFGEPVQIFQACDLMVASGDRGSFSRQGPVFLAAASFLENQLGFGAPHLLGIGFPNERAYKLPEHLGLYTGCLGRIQEISWTAETSGLSGLLWQCQELSGFGDKVCASLDRCWQLMLNDMGERVIGVRNARYVLDRYVSHPDKQYRVFLVRHRIYPRWQGVIVLRAVDQERMELLDVITPVSCIPALICRACEIAAHAGAKQVYAWLVDNIVPQFAPYASAQDLGVLVPGNRWTKGPLNDSVRGRWWLTGGDTDFH